MPTQKELGYPALRDAYQIIDGIPDKAFDLDDVLQEKGESLQCGTIACAAGWLGLHPTFLQERGVRTKVSGAGKNADLRYYIGPREADFDTAMGHALGIGAEAAYALFAPAYLGRGNNAEHKRIWKKRVIKFLIGQEQSVNPKIIKALK